MFVVTDAATAQGGGAKRAAAGARRHHREGAPAALAGRNRAAGILHRSRVVLDGGRNARRANAERNDIAGPDVGIERLSESWCRDADGGDRSDESKFRNTGHNSVSW